MHFSWFHFPNSQHFAKASCGGHFCLALSTLLNPLVGKCRSIWLEEVAHSETKQETEDAGTNYMRLEVKKGRFEGIGRYRHTEKS